MKTMSARKRSAMLAMVAGLGLWLGAAGAALAADQWFDSGTAAGIQPSSGTTGGLVWADSPGGSVMWASTRAGTTTPALWTNSNNAYFTAAGTATVGVNGATAGSVIFDSAGAWVFTNAGAPFTVADLTLKRGTVTLYSNSLGSSSSTPVTLGDAQQSNSVTLKLGTVAAGDNTFSIGNLTSAGPAAMWLTNTVAGSTPILSAQTLARSGRGILVIAPTNNTSLGVTSKALFTGGTALTTGGILAPWLVGLPMTGSGSLYDFVTYGANGLTTNGVYQTGAWDNTKVVSGSGTLTVNTNAHALKLTGNVIINNGVTFTLGDGTCAGLLLDNTGGSANMQGNGTLSVGTAELIIHSAASTAFIYPTISGSGGLTLNALRGDGTGGSVTISNMTYTGDTWIQNGTLGVAPSAGITHTYADSIRGLGNFTKSGAGTLNLTGNSSINGSLSVSAGTLNVSNGASLYFGGNITFASLATLNIGGLGARSTVTNLGSFGVSGGVNTSNTATTITNAILKTGGAVTYHNFGNNNTINVLADGLWDVSGNTFIFGRLASTGNVMTVNGGIVTNVGLLSIGDATTSSSNSIVITNGGIYSAGVTLNGINSMAAVQHGGVWNLGNGALTVNASVPAPQSAVQTSGSGMFTNVGGITLSGGNQTFTASAASNFYLGTAGAIILGSAGSGNTLTITGQTFTTSASSTIGNFAGSNSNTLNVLAGTVWKGGAQTLVIGKAGATGNVVRVDGGGVSGGAIVTNFSATGLLSGFGNSFILTNGAQAWVTANPTMIGIGNTWKVVGGGMPGVTTLADLAGTAGSIGNDATSVGNTLVVDGNGVYGGAVVTNGSQLRFGDSAAGANSNGLSIVNGGWFFAPNTFNVGNNSGANANFLNVGSAGTPSYLAGSPTLGNAAGSFYNTMTTTNAVIRGAVTIGASSSSNTVTVLKDTAWDFAGNGLLFSGSKTSTGNVMVINGGVVSNVANVNFGNGANASMGGSLTVSNGGQLFVNGAVKLANSTSSSNNAFTIASGGFLEADTLNVGASTNANVITNAGGIYQFTSATPTITTNGAAGGSIFINSGTISFRNVPASAPANLTNNWGGINLARLTWNGNNTLRLNNSIATNSCAGGYTFNTGLGATNYYRLEMINGTTRILGQGITIGGAGSVLFSNTTATIGGAFTNNGTMTVVDSLVTFATNCVLDGGSLVMSTNAASSNLVSVAGSLTTSGNIALDVTGLVVGKPSQVTLFNVTGAFNDNATWSVTPSSYKVQKQGQSLVLGRITSGMVIIIR